MIQIQEFSEKQLELLRFSTDPEHKMLMAGGAVRSGKSTAVNVGYCVWLLSEGMQHKHALAGVSVESAMRNCGDDMMLIFESLGANVRLTRDMGTRIVVEMEHQKTDISVFGATDEKARRRVQGATFMSAVMDEVALHPESFFVLLLSRLSVPGAKTWMTYNPEGPAHWFKKGYHDKADSMRAKVMNFWMDDNPGLEEEFKEWQKSIYSGHWYARMIEGLWAGASGLVFPKWKSTKEPGEGRLILSLDWGTSTVFCALAFRQKTRHRVTAVSELYYDAEKAGVTRNEDEHLEALSAWVQELEPNYPGTTIYVDPATPVSFKRKMRKLGLKVRQAKNDVIPGLVVTDSRLSNEEITIHEACTNLIEQLHSYLWDKKKQDQGIDAPLKENDHTCDALRYFAYSTGKTMFMHELPTVEEVGL